MVNETKESSLQKSPTDSSLAQLGEQETDDQDVMGSNPTGGNFDKIILVLCNFRSVRYSDRNASDWPIEKYPIIHLLIYKTLMRYTNDLFQGCTTYTFPPVMLPEVMNRKSSNFIQLHTVSTGPTAASSVSVSFKDLKRQTNGTFPFSVTLKFPFANIDK